jgi:4,5-dihydroxyphthalate decarboxylase
MPQLKVTIALSHYDRHMPFLDGSLRTEDIDLNVMIVGQSSPLRDGANRHERMLQRGEFDVCELSLSSYLMSRNRGLPFLAIPVFPRRLFSHSQMWVNSSAGISSPKDLIGKTVGLSTFQTTLSVLAKGDLQSEYGVSWRDIKWVVAHKETVPFTPEKGVRIEIAPSGKKMGKMLKEGEIDALFMPHPPQEALEGSREITRLFPDPKKEEVAYFRRNGFYPIMHVVAFSEDVLRKHPSAGAKLMNAFEKAKETCKEFYDDPNWSRLIWGRHLFEEERLAFGSDPWPYGVEKNRNNLERFVGYSFDQGLIDRKMTVEELFAESTLAT